MALDQKIKKAKQVILEASKKWPAKNIAVAWTGGKDSTVLLHLVKETFQHLRGGRLAQRSLGEVGMDSSEVKKARIPFRVFFNDSTLEFPEVYDFVKKLKKDWQLDLVWQKHLPEDLEAYQKLTSFHPQGDRPARRSLGEGGMDSLRVKQAKEQAMEIMRIAKINAINFVIANYNIKAFMSGIRWDEHQSRSKETYFSPRSTHTRVHPILDFTHDDIWDYIKIYNVPYVSLYDKGYKSLGEAPFTKPVKDKNAAERAGREATKEKTMERLRQLGYW